MDLNEARAVLRTGPQPGAEAYVRYAHASAVVYANHMAAGSTRTADAAPRRARDDEPGPDWRTARTDPNSSAGRHDMGSNPESKVGAVLVATLPGERTAYFISALPDGSGCGLYRHVSANNAIKGVTMHDRGRMMRDARAVDGVRQFQQGMIASRVANFWEDQRDPQTRDRSPQPAPNSIAARNAAFWEKHSA